jgi:hypothetical protein
LEGGDSDEAKIQHCSDPFGFGSDDHAFSCYSHDDPEKIGGGVVNENSGEDTWGRITCVQAFESAKPD